MSLVMQAGERPSPSAALEPLLRLVSSDMAEVNAIILSQARSEVELIPELAKHLINSGGKRLRPMLTIAAAKLCRLRRRGPHQARRERRVHAHRDAAPRRCGGRERYAARQEKRAHSLGQSGERAGRRFSPGPGVQNDGGGWLAGRAEDPVRGVGGDCRGRGDAARSLQGHDHHGGGIPRRDRLEDRGAVRGGVRNRRRDRLRSAAEQSALRTYGTNIGLAFQLIDDALDYSGEAAKLGKRVGDDFREGKITLPVVVLSYRHGSAEERAFWQRTLQDGDIQEGDLDEAIALMRRHNAIAETVERARMYGREAQRRSTSFPRARRRRQCSTRSISASAARIEAVPAGSNPPRS